MENIFENDEFDPEELFREPNDGAYEKDELRTGPPLDYVAEKFRRSMEMTHYLINTLITSQLDTDRKENALFQARSSFRYQLTGYLALNNMLALANAEDFFNRLENYSTDDFHDWLDQIDQRGSITG